MKDDNITWTLPTQINGHSHCIIPNRTKRETNTKHDSIWDTHKLFGIAATENDRFCNYVARCHHWDYMRSSCMYLSIHLTSINRLYDWWWAPEMVAWSRHRAGWVPCTNRTNVFGNFFFLPWIILRRCVINHEKRSTGTVPFSLIFALCVSVCDIVFWQNIVFWRNALYYVWTVSNVFHCLSTKSGQARWFLVRSCFTYINFVLDALSDD